MNSRVLGWLAHARPSDAAVLAIPSYGTGPLNHWEDVR
jgi:hypothetical protein